MSVSAVKLTSANLWLFVGWAQDVSYNSLTEDVHVLPSGWPFLMKPGSSIRRRRASASVCLTPPQPANGQYEFDKNSCDNTADCQFSEGTALEPGSQLIYRCNAGYRATGNTEVYCRSRGKWSTIPECVEVKCNSLNSVSTMVSCTRFGQWVNCDSAVLPETRAEVACRRGYKKDTDFITTRRPVVTCNGNGKWVPEPIRCVPVCGLVITHQQPLILGGTVAKIGDFPWHASLFVQVNNEKIFICGATIIQNSLLLTAAHCVYDEGTKTTTQPEKLFVITGNIFRDYDSSAHNPEIVRKAKVKHVYTFCNYYGLTGNYASDIALLILQQPFEYSSILLPACLDDSEYSEQFLEPGAYGRVAGFGRTETSTASGVLQTITVPYVSYSQCRESKHGEQNQAFISSDKFCAGHTNGSAVCEGDSGGGLVFKKGELWYVLGIVSVGLGVDIDRGERTCDRYSYTLYTKVTNYMTWIQDVLSSLESDQPYSSCRPGFSNPHIGGSNTPLQTTVSHCLAPPQPINGKRKLHRNFCDGDVECSVSEGTELKLGSQLIYSCDSQFTIDGSTDVHCTSGGKWTAIPTCVGAPCSSPNGGSGGCTTPRPLSTDNTAGHEIGVIARQKCMEYAKYVNTQRCPPFADRDGQPAKVAPSTGKTKAGSMEFPHMAAIGFVRDDGMIGWYCGGTLISETFVLTTVTCSITKVLGNATWVRVGDLNLVQSVYGATPEDRRVAERIPHPDYKHPVEYHNIALLRLESRVPFNGWIRPACLHTSPTTGTREAIATGWGRAEWLDDKSSDDLLKVTLPFVDLETCNTQWTSGITDGRVPNGIVGDWLMCAGSVGKDTCKGDSGGPLVIHSADKEKERCMYVVVGITSLGRACGTGFPGLYIRVYHYVSWIESVVWGQG